MSDDCEACNGTGMPVFTDGLDAPCGLCGGTGLVNKPEPEKRPDVLTEETLKALRDAGAAWCDETNFERIFQYIDRLAAEVKRLKRERDDARNSDDMAAGIFDEIRGLLATAGCCHGEGKDTPPMMFAEWIVCVMKKKVDHARRRAFEEASWIAELNPCDPPKCCGDNIVAALRAKANEAPCSE